MSQEHPDRQLTVRQCFERHYLRDDLSRRTVQRFRHDLGRWEHYSGDPAIGDVDNATIAGFRQAMIDAGYKPATINGTWRSIVAVFRVMAPQQYRNPWGLGVIERVPAMRPVKEPHKRPRRLMLDDLARMYVACRHAEHPRRSGVHPADWWRGLLCMAYTSGLRKGDLAALTWEQIDLESATLDFTARKTGKADLWPLHPCAIPHLERIRNRTEGRVFRGLLSNDRSGSFYKRWRFIQGKAGIVEPFSLHDIRRVAGSEMERVRAGLGTEFLQHAPRSVSDVSYLNRLDELREALTEMRLPAGFQAGPKVAARKLEEVRQARVEMTHDDFTVPDGPDPRDWKFKTGAVWIRGRWFPMRSAVRLAVLTALATSPVPVAWTRLRDIIRASGMGSVMDEEQRVAVLVSNIRQRLRRLLGLTDCDPVPCVQRRNGPSAGEAHWTLWIPPEVGRVAS